MLDINGRYRCDCEIGSVKNGWRTCGKPAVCQSVTIFAGHRIILEWCAKHRNRIGKHLTKSAYIESVRELSR